MPSVLANTLPVAATVRHVWWWRRLGADSEKGCGTQAGILGFHGGGYNTSGDDNDNRQAIAQPSAATANAVLSMLGREAQEQ